MCKLKTSAQCLMEKGLTFLTKNPWVCPPQRLTNSKTRTEGLMMGTSQYYRLYHRVKKKQKSNAMLNFVQLFTRSSLSLAPVVAQIASMFLFYQQVAAASNSSERESTIAVYHNHILLSHIVD